MGVIGAFTVAFSAPANVVVRSFVAGGKVTESDVQNVSSVTHYTHAERVTAESNDVDMQTQPTIYVAWKDDEMPTEPIEVTLGKILERVREVIPAFDRFL